MNNNTSKNVVIITMSGFAIQLIFKLMGNSNKSSIIQVTIIMVLCIILAFYMTHGTTKKRLGNKLSIVGAILVLVLGIVISVNEIIEQCYHQLYMENKRLLCNILMGSFFVLALFFMIAAGIVSDRDNK